MAFLSKKSSINGNSECGLVKCLTATDLTLLGIGAIIGAGIFVITGVAAATRAGPAIVLSYVVAGLACAFSALAYAELASSVGGCGSAYNYAYVGLGEIFAWIIGWDLLLEYALSVSAVSVGWSGYVNDVLKAMHINLPLSLLHGPLEGGYCNILALGIIVVLAGLLIWGVKSSVRVNNIMVLIKLSVILLFILIAAVNVNPQNWTPFFPYGWNGVMSGASLIFFAYIGFDAISTAAEEAVNPQRDLPRGIIFSLIICTIIYMLTSGLLTGIMHYSKLNVSSPISYALLQLGYRFASAIIAVGAIAGLTTVMLVMFYGVSRIFLSMSRDYLLPNFFAKINDKTRTPIRIMLTAGVVMGLFSALLPITDLAELVNIGTLAAFITVCLGVISLRYTHPELHRPFKTPFMPWVPLLGVVSCAYLIISLPWVTILRFIIWMVVGIVVYFVYSQANVQRNKKTSES